MKRIVFIIALIAINIFAYSAINETMIRDAKEFYSKGYYHRAEKLLLSAVNVPDSISTKGDRVNPEYHYWLGQTYLAQQKYTLAYKEFELFSEFGFGDQTMGIDNVLDIIARGIYQSPESGTVYSLGKMRGNINSEYSDFAPVISDNGRDLYYTSSRLADLKKDNIWISRNISGNWRKSYLVKELSSDGHDSFGSISKDGNVAYVYGTFMNNKKGAIFTREKNNGKWGAPKLIEQINTKRTEMHPFIYEDEDEKILFFSSNSEEGFGGLDLYVSIFEDGEWSNAINLGPSINTEKNEETPFFDGETLFFASDGHPGLGKLDIFKATRGLSYTEWLDIENLGIYVNSVRNDRYFVKDENSQKAYLSSDRVGGKGFEDIYVLNLEKKVAESEVANKCKIYGHIMDDSAEQKPVKASINFTVQSEFEKYQMNVVSKEDGYFELLVPHNSTCEYKISEENYMTVLGVIAIENQNEIEHNIFLSELIVEKEIVIENIYFDFNKATLQDSSFATLDILKETCLSNPNLVIEISGHTDNVGSEKYNQNLSQLRADAVVQYLVDNGVDAKSLISKGYGEAKPIADNDTEVGRAKNRRVEMKVLEDISSEEEVIIEETEIIDETENIDNEVESIENSDVMEETEKVEDTNAVNEDELQKEVENVNEANVGNVE